MRAMKERGLALALFECGGFFLRFFGLGASLFKLVHATCCIHEHLLSCVKRMRCTADAQHYHWIFVTVFPFNRLGSTGTGAAQERKAGGRVLENHRSVILWVNVTFHIRSANLPIGITLTSEKTKKTIRSAYSYKSKAMDISTILPKALMQLEHTASLSR